MSDMMGSKWSPSSTSFTGNVRETNSGESAYDALQSVYPDSRSEQMSERDADGETEDDFGKIELVSRYPNSATASVLVSPPKVPDLLSFDPYSEHSDDAILAAESSERETKSNSIQTSMENGRKISRKSTKDVYYGRTAGDTPRSTQAVRKAGHQRSHTKRDAVQTKLHFPVIERAVPDKECSFCEGTTVNRVGQREEMVSCFRCGNSGHFTCMQFFDDKLIETVKSYDWFCMECKICELCGTKGVDANLCLCDICDRGYHCTCLSPPSSKPPKGGWACDPCTSSSGSTTSRSKNPKKNSANRLKRSHSAISNRPLTSAKNNPISLLKQATTATQTSPYSRPTRSHTPTAPMIPSAKNHNIPASPTSQLHGLTVRIPRRPTVNDKPVNPYHGILTESEADTSLTTPGHEDIQLFERSLAEANKVLGSDKIEILSRSTFVPKKNTKAVPPTLPKDMSLGFDSMGTAQLEFPLPRSMRERASGPESSTRMSIGDFSVGPVEKVYQIRFGDVDIPTWYTAPYPEEFSVLPDGRLWICEHCLSYRKTEFSMSRHALKCKMMQPPGDEIYRYNDVSLYEVDGRKSTIYCQNLCLLSKLFLDHKTLYYDVDPFMFYVLATNSPNGMEFVGYFSKEKRSGAFWNLSCIMTLPIRSRKGWGGWLVSFSYLLSMKEGRVGSPERPLSDLGLITYTNYWTITLFEYLASVEEVSRIQTISDATSMTLSDLCYILQKYGMLHEKPAPEGSSHHDDDKNASNSIIQYSELTKNENGFGQNAGIEDLSGDVTMVYPPRHYTISWDKEFVKNYIKTWNSKGYARVNKTIGLRWSPILTALSDESAEMLASMSPAHAIRAGIREDVWQRNYGHIIAQIIQQSQKSGKEKTKKIKKSNRKNGNSGTVSTPTSSHQSAVNSRASSPLPHVLIVSSGDEFELEEENSGDDRGDDSFD